METILLSTKWTSNTFYILRGTKLNYSWSYQFRLKMVQHSSKIFKIHLGLSPPKNIGYYWWASPPPLYFRYPFPLRMFLYLAPSFNLNLIILISHIIGYPKKLFSNLMLYMVRLCLGSTVTTTPTIATFYQPRIKLLF